MALQLSGKDDDDIQRFLRTVLDAYKNGWCDREDARIGLAHVLDAALNQNANFMGEVRTMTKLHIRSE